MTYYVYYMNRSLKEHLIERLLAESMNCHFIIDQDLYPGCIAISEEDNNIRDAYSDPYLLSKKPRDSFTKTDYLKYYLSKNKKVLKPGMTVNFLLDGQDYIVKSIIEDQGLVVISIPEQGVMLRVPVSALKYE